MRKASLLLKIPDNWMTQSLKEHNMHIKVFGCRPFMVNRPEEINPYSRSESQVKDFGQATRQDKIIAICAQCHVEYVGGYSAIDRIDRNFCRGGKVGYE